MHRNQSVSTHKFAMIPKADIPRSSFVTQKAYKTTFDAGYLIPIYCDEVLPADTFNFNATLFARLATPLVPIMDNMYLDTFFFFVPNRLIWNNWERFMGQQDNPEDSIDYLIPQCPTPVGGYDTNSLQDYMGLPTKGQLLADKTINHCAFWTRAYSLIWNQWFRDENLQDAVKVDKGDGPDNPADYYLLRRGKRLDYFTSSLPFAQKGEAVTLPLGTSAPVVSNNEQPLWHVNGSANMAPMVTDAQGKFTADNIETSSVLQWGTRTGLFADLSEATAATVNQLRQSFAIQKLLERDARGGTRYTEIVRSHFSVISPDARLQRPEYLGGNSVAISINPVAQTSATAVTGTDTPQGHLAAMGTALTSGCGFTQSFTEHGVIIGLASVRADLTYQQGLRRMWSRRTRYDFYFPAFAMLGEQTVLNKEIYVTGDPVQDNAAFGYQERWAEYRYNPSEITGRFRSTAPDSLDIWHLSQHFLSLPTLNTTFIKDTPPVNRVIAVGADALGSQFILDAFYDIKMARPLPLYSVPGLIDHF